MKLRTANNHHKRRARRTVRYYRHAPGWLMEVTTIQHPGPMRRVKFEHERDFIASQDYHIMRMRGFLAELPPLTGLEAEPHKCGKSSVR